MLVNADWEMIALALPATAMAATIRGQRLLLAAGPLGATVATRGAWRDR